ncbi:RNA-directed DNA polymerase, eukaryota, reverse transcriptase zinc-binding domain protein [Tanacetum coccineum]
MLSKILTNRIKVALSQIIDENQSAFVPGRAITDNILLTQELLKGYNCINGPKRCAFKIDIQKAYDTVSWEFLKDIMGRFGFPSKMIGWIMTCISTPKFTICVNGERYGYFKGRRGLRQGDSISPYIFTMVMEMLNLIVKNEIRKNNTFKYHFGCRQLKITHLCFADDLIICLNKDAKREISSIFPFKEGKLPVRYLGVPLITKKISVKECKQLVDKVSQKLNDWKNKSLSYARRAQLIASVLGSMQVYWGSVFLLPKTIVNDIEKLFKRFLWNNGDSCKGKAKVAWLDVCKPNDQGGLGFKPLELWNKTLLVKHLWNIASRKESLWVKWVNIVKLKNRSVWDVNADNRDSWGWKCLLDLRGWISNHMRYKIGDGHSINVWHDKWFNGISLSSLLTKNEIFYAGFKDQDKISDVLGDNGWKWPAHLFTKHPWIANIQVPQLSNQHDRAVWIDNMGSEKRFSTNNVWKDVRGSSSKVSWCDLIWHSNCIPKHTFILWLAAKERLCTQDRLEKWYLSKKFKCSLCNKEPDSHEHLFFKCVYAQYIWKKICRMAKLKLKEDHWGNILEEMSKDKSQGSIWGVLILLVFVDAVNLMCCVNLKLKASAKVIRMSTSNRSSRRQKKVPSWFSNHVMSNSSQKKNDNVEQDNTKEIRVEKGGLNKEIGENDIEINKGVFGNGDNSQNKGDFLDSHKDVSDVPSDNTSNDFDINHMDSNMNNENAKFHENVDKPDETSKKTESYLSKAKKNEVPKKLVYKPTMVNECGTEFSNAEGLRTVIDKGPWMSIDGISALASSLGNPLIMDTMTATMCHSGIGRTDFGRVLVEMDVGKEFKKEIEVQYRDGENKIKGTKKVSVTYDWKPSACTHCKVFGHDYNGCKKRTKTQDEVDIEKKRMEELERGNKMANNDSTVNDRRRNLSHLQNMNKDKGGLQEGKFERHKANNDQVWNRVGNKKQEYRKKQPEVNKEVNDKNVERNNATRKQWPINNMEFEAMKKTANKYSILESLPDDDPVEIRILKDGMIVDQYINKKTQPSVQEAKNWTQDMVGYFKAQWEKGRNKDTEACNNEEEDDDIIEEVNGLGGNVIAYEINGKDNSILHQE